SSKGVSTALSAMRRAAASTSAAVGRVSDSSEEIIEGKDRLLFVEGGNMADTGYHGAQQIGLLLRHAIEGRRAQHIGQAAAQRQHRPLAQAPEHRPEIGIACLAGAQRAGKRDVPIE